MHKCKCERFRDPNSRWPRLHKFQYVKQLDKLEVVGVYDEKEII